MSTPRPRPTRLQFKGNQRNLIVDARGNPHTPKALSANYGYEGADWNRYNQDFTILSYSPNQLIGMAARHLRARAQDLERNSDHVRRFLAIVENNVVGWNGIRLQSKATRSEMTDTPDRPAIRLVEHEWTKWAAGCSVDGQDSLVDLHTMIKRRHIVDGEVFVEMLDGFEDNEHKFALRVWGADACPLGYSDEKKNIQNGIKYNKWGKPEAYYFHPTGYAGYNRESTDYIEVKAERCIHIFTRERPFQRRGITMLASTAERVHMLQKLEKAVLIGTQIAASKMGFFRDPDSMTLDEYTGDGPEVGSDGVNTIGIEPGQFEDIGHKHFEKFDVDYPMTGYENYIHEILRGAASGLNISYHVLANDPSSVNYSTAREFRLADTDAWRKMQHTDARKFYDPVFRNWLRIQLLRPPFARYRSTDFARLAFVKWNPRGWQWVDPQKEANGNMLAVQMGVKSLTDVAAEQGKDFEEVVEQIQRDREYADAHGVDLSAVWAAVALQPQPPQNDAESEA